MKSFIYATMFLVPGLAWATLGQKVASIENDKQVLAAPSKIVEAHSAFAVHQMISHNRTIREYVDNSGNVFAVSWRGMNDPDVSALLGNYADELKTARAQVKHTPGHHPLNITTTNLSYNRHGHMRALTTTIYLNKQLPAGVSREDIK